METRIVVLRNDGGQVIVTAVIYINGKEVKRTGEFPISISQLDYLIEHGCLN